MIFSTAVFRYRLLNAVQCPATHKVKREVLYRSRRTALFCKVFWSADRVSEFLRSRLESNHG